MKRFEGARAVEEQTFGVEAIRKMVIGPPHRFDEGEEPEEYIRWLADDFFARGQLQRCTFTEDSAKRIVITSGRNRRLAALYINDHPERYVIPPKLIEKYGGWPLECSYVRTTDTQGVLLALAENIKRRDYSPIDKMLAAQHLMDHCGLTQEECVEPLGLSAQCDVSRLLSLVPLGRGVHSLVHKGALRPNQARQLLGLTPEEIAPIVAQIELGAKAAKVLAQVNVARRNGKPKKPSMADFRRELKAIDNALARDILKWLDGNQAAGAMETIIYQGSVEREIARREREAAA